MKLVLIVIGGVALCFILLLLLRPVYRKNNTFSYNGEIHNWDTLFVAVAKKIGITGPVIVALNSAPDEEKKGFAAKSEAEGLPLEAAMARFIAASAMKKHYESIKAKKHKAAASYREVGEAAAQYADTLAATS